MLLGNRETFGIEIRPLIPTWERRYPPESAAWAALLVWVGGTNLCNHSIRGTDRVEEAVNVPLAPLANWLVNSWPNLAFEERARLFPTSDALHEDLAHWGNAPSREGLDEDSWIDAREEWWSRHFVSAGAEGALLPHIAIARQDEKLIVDWQTTDVLGELLFLAPAGRRSVAWKDAENIFSSFVEFISEWLKREGLGAIYPWIGSENPLRQQERSFIELLELYTGRSRDELLQLAGTRTAAEVATRLGLEPASSDPGSSPVTQALRDLPPGLPQDVGDVLQELNSLTNSETNGGFHELRVRAFDAQRAATAPEDAGYLAATALRSELGLNGKPIDDTEALLKFLDIQAVDSNLSIQGTRMIAGLRQDAGAAVIVLRSGRTSVRWGRRFEHARALANLLLDPLRGKSVGAASSPFSQGSRRRRSGAFAAEFLLPEAALVQATSGTLDRAAEPAIFETLLSRYGVGAMTAAHHLWNRGLLSSTELRDQLINEYASPQQQG